jgi:hypothetical protein
MKKILFFSMLILFSCSKHKKNYKSIDVQMTPMGLYGIDCHKEYSAMFVYNSETFLVGSIADKYKNSLLSLPVTIDFKVVKTIYCDTDGQLNKKAYEVKILSIKDR